MTWLPKSVVCLKYYDRFRFRSDASAALLLSLQIFPLAIAVAIAIGVPAVYGVSCAAVAGLVASLFGDSKIRVSAPNIVFVTVAASLFTREGILGLASSTLVAGLLLLFFGATRLGAAIRVLPRPVTLGFMTGIAVRVAFEQLPNFLGLNPQVAAGHGARGLLMLGRQIAQVEPRSILVASAALLVMVICGRTWKSAPVGLVAVALGIVLVRFGHFPVHTVEPFYLSKAMWPLHSAGVLRLGLFGRVVAPAFVIAVLAAIESLHALSAATGATGEQSNPDGELFLQGGANLVSACMGGLPVSGVRSYTLENVRLGAQTPVAGILQAVLLAVFLLLAAPIVRFIPLPVISALILSSAFGVVNWREIPRPMKVPPSETASWAVVSLLIVFADLPIAIAIGLFIGMFLYIRNLREPPLANLFPRLTLW